MKTFTQAALIILDGWGYREDAKDNAIATAKTPNFDKLWEQYPHALLEASGLAVGLTEGQMGNSEIGHTTIGTGKVMDTDLVRINKSISDRSFHRNESFMRLIEHVKRHGSKIHAIGLLSGGGVHSHEEHLYAFLELCKEQGLKKEQVVIHAFTDARDVAPGTGAAYLKKLEDVLKEIGVGVIGSFGGRYHGMDRAGNWDRIAMVENAMFECEGSVCDLKDQPASEFMKAQYKKDPTGKIDEYLEHHVVKAADGGTYPVTKNDGIFFFNFRADRARSLTQRIVERKEALNLYFVGMTNYGASGTDIAFSTSSIETCLAEAISKAGLSQSHVSESEKYPHVTFYFNGGSDTIYPNEKQIKVESRTDIATHDLAPEMMSKEIVNKAITELEAGSNFIVVNFPNADVVGHTGNVPAIIAAIEAADRECGRLVDAILKRGGVAFVTADHGNAEVNVDPKTGEKHTAHTINPVPAIVTSKDLRFIAPSEMSAAEPHHAVVGGLADLAPTMLALLGIETPKAMTGKVLVK